MVRPESWIRPAGVSPVRVIAGEPGSRPRSVIERLRAERGVKSLFGGSKRAGRSAIRCESCSLVRVTTGEPSRSCHGEGHVRHTGFRMVWRVPPGYGERHVRTVWFGTGETRLHSLVSKDHSYKPMVKSSGVQRESDGVVVLVTIARNAVVGKGPDFGLVDGEGNREGMAETARPNNPLRLLPGGARTGAGSSVGKRENFQIDYGWRPSHSCRGGLSSFDPRGRDCSRVPGVRVLRKVA